MPELFFDGAFSCFWEGGKVKLFVFTYRPFGLVSERTRKLLIRWLIQRQTTSLDPDNLFPLCPLSNYGNWKQNDFMILMQRNSLFRVNWQIEEQTTTTGPIQCKKIATYHNNLSKICPLLSYFTLKNKRRLLQITSRTDIRVWNLKHLVAHFTLQRSFGLLSLNCLKEQINSTFINRWHVLMLL